MTTYVVTGGAGFIGSHVVDELLHLGFDVVVVDNFLSGAYENLPDHPKLSVIEKDVLDCQVSDFPASIDGVVHLAARPSVVDSWVCPLAVHQANLSSTVAVIELCQKLDVSRIVFASSAAVYGNQEVVPVSEDIRPNPQSPYGLHKLTGESYLQLFCQYSGFSAVSLRFFNVFGPRQQPGSPYSGIISLLLDAMRLQRPFTIYGDGEQTRDFIYVKDVAGFISQALQQSVPGGENTVLNIGSGKQVSINRLVDIMRAHFPDWHEELRYALERPGDIKKSQADTTKTTALLGAASWSIDAGLRQMIDKGM